MDSPVTQNPNPVVAEPTSQIGQTKNSHTILPIVLIVVGVIEMVLIILPMLVSLLFVAPRIQQLYQEVNAQSTYNPLVGFLILVILILLVVAQIVYGFWLIKLKKKQGILPTKHKRIIIGILFGTLLVFMLSRVALIYSSVLPIYNITSNF